MPPHLHPRSPYTLSLFTTTLLASFLVVGVPHLIPCPAPRVAFADEATTTDENGVPVRRRRRRRCAVDEDGKKIEILKDGKKLGNSIVEGEGTENGDTSECGAVGLTQLEIQERREKAMKRECPIPKPGGIVGSLFGFQGNSTTPTPSSTSTASSLNQRHPDTNPLRPP